MKETIEKKYATVSVHILCGRLDLITVKQDNNGWLDLTFEQPCNGHLMVSIRREHLPALRKALKAVKA